MATSYIYLVFEIPINGSQDVNWFKCHRDASTNVQYCNSNEYCYNIINKGPAGGYQTCQCAGSTDQVVTTYGCSGSDGLTSLYTYMGGNYLTPGNYTRIPGVGSNSVRGGAPYFPMDLSNPSDTIMGTYAGVAFPSAIPSGYNTGNAISTQTGYLVVAYDTSWFATWQDLDIIAPPGNIFKGKNSLILNTTTNTNNPQFYLQGTGNTQGQPIPSIESQFVSLLGNFCGLQSDMPKPGVNPGLNFSSNFQALRTDGGTNYCYQAMVSNVGNIYGLDDTINQYCANFGTTSSDPVPPECYCQTPGAVPNNAFNELLAVFADPGTGQPAIPAGQGNLNCWWQPCMETNDYLIPSAQLNPGTCPSICQEITNLIASGGGSIIVNNSTIKQSINCCATNASNCDGSAPSGPCSSTNLNGTCPSGESCVSGACVVTPPGTGCTSNSDCTANQTCVSGTCVDKESFWDKYKIWIILAVVIFSLFVLLMIYLIFHK